MKLSSLLNQELIFIESPVTTKQQAIDLLIQNICKSYTFELDKNSVESAVKERESLGGTTFETGIAVPHARLDKFNDLIIGICVPKVPILEKGISIRMIVLILTNKTSSSLYLNTLASFIGISKNDQQFSTLLQSSSDNEFIETIKSSDIQIKKELTVADIMSRKLFTVTQETTLKELSDIFYTHKFSYIPVLSDDGFFIGEVTISDVLRLGIPNYATMVGNLKFLKTFEPLEELLKNEQNLKVKQIMRKPSSHFTEDTSILEAVLDLTQNKRRHVPVLRDKKIVGVISTMDILNKVLRG
jgi:PTS system nitrogen regulatory IIA component